VLPKTHGSYVPAGLGIVGALSQGSAPLHLGYLLAFPTGTCARSGDLPGSSGQFSGWSCMERGSTWKHEDALGSYVPAGLGLGGALSQGSAPLHPGLSSCVPSGNFAYSGELWVIRTISWWSCMERGSTRKHENARGSYVPAGLGIVRALSQGSAPLHPGLSSCVPSGNLVVAKMVHREFFLFSKARMGYPCVRDS